ncbi:MAG: hypothetical protein ACJ8ER_11680 [Allosphingosinicella sp.]
MKGEIRLSNLRNRCSFLSKETVKLALLRSYIADVSLCNDQGNLELYGLPAALFFLNVVEECALSSVRDESPTAWPMPETDENLLISTKNDVLSIEASLDGVNWQGMRVFCINRDDGTRLFYNKLRDLIAPDRNLIESLGAKIIDNPVIRHIFDYRYI